MRKKVSPPNMEKELRFPLLYKVYYSKERQISIFSHSVFCSFDSSSFDLGFSSSKPSSLHLLVLLARIFFLQIEGKHSILTQIIF